MFWKKRISENSIPLESKDYRAVAITDLGTVRKSNEDQVRFVRPSDLKRRQERGYLAVVADGMGGHSAGEIASGLAVDILSKVYYEHTGTVKEALLMAMKKANEVIFQQARSNTEWQGMGTTCTAVVIIDSSMIIAHIGDSRAYLIRPSQIYQLTEDHTYVQELLSSGKLNPMDIYHHPQRHVLTQALGTAAGRHGDLFQSEFTLQPGDRLLLCTDGFYEYFSPEEIKSTLLKLKLHEAGELFLQQARERGGHDNISLLMIEELNETIRSDYPTKYLNAHTNDR